MEKLALTNGAASSVDVLLPNEILVGSPQEIFSKYWQTGGLIIAIGSIGAITRLIVPFMKSKEEDPAVLVLDSMGSKVIPLIGGHKAGGEELALNIAAELGGIAVITGDSRTQNRLALDNFGESWGWKRTGNKNDWDYLMKKQARGVQLMCYQNSGSTLWQNSESAKNSLAIIQKQIEFPSSDFIISSKVQDGCCWCPATIWMGIGCERGTSLSLIERSVKVLLNKAGLAFESIAGISSIDLKSDESALISLSQVHDWPMRFFRPEMLASVKVPNPSKIVESAMGTSSVAEAAALVAAGEGASLLVEKTIFYSDNSEVGSLTIALAESLVSYAPKRGELHLVGSGPGSLSFLTNDARLALSKSVVWVGYSMYLDLLEPIRRLDQVRVDSNLTFEKDRCLYALALASQGIRVSLVSSGDSGIYGMAGLALQLLLSIKESDRPGFFIHPGVSAMQMAASRIGSPLMEDFCAISLSDRLTPWTKILERLIGAAKGDFVIALYNPKSQDRNWQLQAAINLLLDYRSPNTPVALSRQLAREDENVRLFTLDNVPAREVDMLTILLIGNSRSYIEDGWFVNPRGYKID